MEWLLLLLAAGFLSKKKAPSASTPSLATALSSASRTNFLANPAYPAIPIATSAVPVAVDSGGAMVPAPDVSTTHAAIADALTDLNGQYIAFLDQAGFIPSTTQDPGNTYGFTAYIAAKPERADFVTWLQTFKPSVWDAAEESWNAFQRSLVDAGRLSDFNMAIETVRAAGTMVETKINSMMASLNEFQVVHAGNLDMDTWALNVLPGLIDQVHLGVVTNAGGYPSDIWHSNWPATMINAGELGGAVGRMYQAIRRAEEEILGVGPAPSNDILSGGEGASIMALFHTLHRLALELPDQDANGLATFQTASASLVSKITAAINAIHARAFKYFIASEETYKLATPATWGGGGGRGWTWFGITIDAVPFLFPTGVFPTPGFSVPYWDGNTPVMMSGSTWMAEWNNPTLLGNTFGTQTGFNTMKAHFENYFDLVYNPARGA